MDVHVCTDEILKIDSLQFAMQIFIGGVYMGKIWTDKTRTPYAGTPQLRF